MDSSEEALHEQLRLLQELHRSQEQILNQGKAENVRLREALRSLVGSREQMLDNVPSGDEDDQEEELGTTEDSDDGDSVDSDSEESEDVESEDPYYDPFGNVRRCIRCSWEVVNNHCQSIECQVRYKRGSDGTSDTESMGEELDDDVDDNRHREGATDRKVIPSSRRLAARGTTPMKENPEDIHPKYANRVEEYIQLICRGATSQMCEEFNLEFTDERGIIAWATPELFKVFSGPGMVEGDEWRIHLGRQIELTCSDPDGFMFISGLLEDAMFYPLFPQSISAPKFQWETVKDRNGIWVTRPKVAFDDGQVEDDDVEMDEFEVGDAGNESEDELPDALANEYSSTYSSCGSPDLGLDESDIDPPPHVIPNARIPDHTYNCSEDDELDELENSGEDELDSEDDELYSGDEEVQAGLVDGHRSTREISSTTSQGPPWNQRWRAG